MRTVYVSKESRTHAVFERYVMHLEGGRDKAACQYNTLLHFASSCYLSFQYSCIRRLKSAGVLTIPRTPVPPPTPVMVAAGLYSLLRCFLTKPAARNTKRTVSHVMDLSCTKLGCGITPCNKSSITPRISACPYAKSKTARRVRQIVAAVLAGMSLRSNVGIRNPGERISAKAIV